MTFEQIIKKSFQTLHFQYFNYKYYNHIQVIIIINKNIMGGGYYDRDVVYVPPNTGVKYGNNVIGKSSKLNPGLDPKNYVKQGNRIEVDNLNPIVFALDVTGSMGSWPKVIYDKLPMFYGQIILQGYLVDPAISFCAIGDVLTDRAPLQVTHFSQGKQIDESIKKLWLQGAGGGNKKQSYELAAYFYNHYVKNNSKEKSFFFITGDEGYFQNPSTYDYEKVIGQKPPGNTINALQQWKKLMSKYQVFHLKKEYQRQGLNQQTEDQWVATLGRERVLKTQNPKACIDVILGAIALTTGKTLNQYIDDMRKRGQDNQRVQQVVTALQLYADKIGKNKKKQPEIKKQQIQKLNIHEQKEELKKQEQKQVEFRSDLKNMKQIFKNELPEAFYCPITGEIFVDPVLTCDGQTYQRSAIAKWFENHDTSPLTGIHLQNKNLIANKLLKKSIAQVHQKYKKQI